MSSARRAPSTISRVSASSCGTFWTGYFAVPPGQAVQRDDAFELLLGDGRRNKIRIERVNQSSAGMTASFGRG